MAYFSTGYALTKQGEALQAKVEAGATLTLTKLQLGDGTVESVMDYYERTALFSPRDDVEITTVAPFLTATRSACKVTGSLMNIEVEEGYDARELGIFAKDTDEREILYAVSYDDTPTYIPSKFAGAEIELDFDVYISISSDTVVEVKQLTLPDSMKEVLETIETCQSEIHVLQDKVEEMKALTIEEIQDMLVETGLVRGVTVGES